MKKRVGDNQMALFDLLHSTDEEVAATAVAQAAGEQAEQARLGTFTIADVFAAHVPPRKRDFAGRAPLILMDASDARGVTAAIKNRVVPGRLELFAARPDAEEATDMEAMLYLMSASLSFPLSHSFTNIYLYLAGQLLPAAKEAIPDVPTSLDISEQYQLTQLKSWMYRSQVKHLKLADRGKPGPARRKTGSRVVLAAA